jgi:predicted phosphohydrolase
MALYAMGDLHLSLTADKSMEVFGPAWERYTAVSYTHLTLPTTIGV